MQKLTLTVIYQKCLNCFLVEIKQNGVLKVCTLFLLGKAWVRVPSDPSVTLPERHCICEAAKLLELCASEERVNISSK